MLSRASATQRTWGKPCWVRPSSPVLSNTSKRSSYLAIYSPCTPASSTAPGLKMLGGYITGYFPYRQFMDLTKCPWIYAFFFWARWCNLPPQPPVASDPETNSLQCKKYFLVFLLNQFLLVLMHTLCSSLVLDKVWSRLAIKRPRP